MEANGDLSNALIYDVKDENGNIEKSIRVNYNALNKVLNAGIEHLDDLVTGGAIVDATEGVTEDKKIKTFNEIKPFIAKYVKQIFNVEKKNAEDWFTNGDLLLNANIIQIANLDSPEEFRRVRFADPLAILTTKYRNLESFLGFFGINSHNIGNIEGDFFTAAISQTEANHVVNVTVDLKRIRELLEAGKTLNTIKDIVLFYFDSDRYGNEKNFGEILKLGRFVNRKEQKRGTCWYHALTATITMAKNRYLFQRIKKNRIKLYKKNEKVNMAMGELPNEFEVRQTLEIQPIAIRGDIGNISGESLAENIVNENYEGTIARYLSNGILMSTFSAMADKMFLEKEKELGENLRMRPRKSLRDDTLKNLKKRLKRYMMIPEKKACQLNILIKGTECC
ncbi:MAG: hypothetical protein LBB24_03735 [Rickettsiales bacterium]|nr:hypothetical protein [Rickettsiales bacterium]